MKHTMKSYPLLFSTFSQAGVKYTVTSIFPKAIIVASDTIEFTLHWAPSKSVWQSVDKTLQISF